MDNQLVAGTIGGVLVLAGIILIVMGLVLHQKRLGQIGAGLILLAFAVVAVVRRSPTKPPIQMKTEQRRLPPQS